jgi:hypothetical protein
MATISLSEFTGAARICLDSDRDRRDQSDWREVLDDVVAGIGRHARARRCHQDGVAVGRSFRRRADADYGTCAGPVLDNDLLAERRRELGGDDPADGIDAATGRERDDQRDRTGGIVLGHRGRAIGERNERDTEQSGSVIQSKHGKLPSRVMRVPSTQAIKTGNRGQRNGVVVQLKPQPRMSARDPTSVIAVMSAA